MTNERLYKLLMQRIGKRHAAFWGTLPVTIGAVGFRNGERFVMGTTDDGCVVLGAPLDFSIPPKRSAKLIQ